jgi:hypothetical protein
LKEDLDDSLAPASGGGVDREDAVQDRVDRLTRFEGVLG